jgi:hypothetical protein
VKERKDNEISSSRVRFTYWKTGAQQNGMSNYDILTLQSETAKRHIEFAIRNRIRKIVLSTVLAKVS